MVSVLHINNIAGTASLISQQQRKMDIKSDVLVFSKNQFDFGHDFIVESKKLRKVLSFWKIKSKPNLLSLLVTGPSRRRGTPFSSGSSGVLGLKRDLAGLGI